LENDTEVYPTLVLGGASWNTMIYLDQFPEPRPKTITTARHQFAAGSTGIGKAMALKALGHNALLHATVGEDDQGQQLRKHCLEHGLSVWFDIDPGGTSRHLNIMDAQGQRISIFLFNGSPQPPVDASRLAKSIAQASTIFLNITVSSIPLLPMIAHSSADVWVDLHDYDGSSEYYDQFIAQADVLQFSDEAVPDSKALMRHLIQKTRLVVCTRAGKGSLALDAAGQWHELPAAPAVLRDSNTFFVALWHALNTQQPLPHALRFAAAAAAMAVESLALVPEILSPSSVAAKVAAWR
jgi:acarbose 7IV-phosphotransferase